MSYNFDKSSHAVYSLQYHLIIVVKCRRKILNNPEIKEFLKQKVLHLSKKYNIKIINQEVDSDHIHILFRAHPTTDLTKWINVLKGTTGKSLRYNFPQIKKKLLEDLLWSPSYCLVTTGEVTLSQLKEYVESQGPKK